MKRLLVTGGSGFLGSQLTQLATVSPEAAYPDWEVYPTYFSHPISHPNAVQVDLRNRKAVEAAVARLKPAAIIHQAISSRSHDEIAAIIPAARHIAEAAIDHHVRLVHVSTDMVFDGENAPYTEQSPTAPLSPYGAAKAFAEGLITSMMPEALIVRPSLIYSFDPVDKQTGWILEGMRKGEAVRLFTDEFRCPIWVDTVSLALLELAATRHEGVLNLGGPQSLNRWEHGMKMLKYLGVEPGPNVVKSTVVESGLKRPRDLTMDVSKAKRWLRTPLLTVDEAFEAHCKNNSI